MEGGRLVVVVGRGREGGVLLSFAPQTKPSSFSGLKGVCGGGGGGGEWAVLRGSIQCSSREKKGL